MTDTAHREGFVPDPPKKDAADLYRILIIGLLAIIGLSVVGAVVLVAVGREATGLIGVGTAALTGLLGLFIPASKTST